MTQFLLRLAHALAHGSDRTERVPASRYLRPESVANTLSCIGQQLTLS